MYWKSFVNRYILVISWRLIRISHCQRIVRIISLKRKCTKRSEQSVTTFKANYWMFSDTKNVLTTLSNVLYVHEIPGSIIIFFFSLIWYCLCTLHFFHIVYWTSSVFSVLPFIPSSIVCSRPNSIFSFTCVWQPWSYMPTL